MRNNALVKSPQVSFIAVLALLVTSVSSTESSRGLDYSPPASDAAEFEQPPPEQLQQILTELKQSAERSQLAGKKSDAARALIDAGRIQLELNQPEEALFSYRKAYSLTADPDLIELRVDSLNGTAEVHLLLKQEEDALRVIAESLHLSRSVNYVKGQAQALLTRSDFENYANHIVALNTAYEALRLWELADDKVGIAKTYAHIGRCNLALNNLDESARNYTLALGLWRELNNAPQQAEVLIMMSYGEIRKADWDRTIELMSQAQALIDDRYPKQMGQIAGGLADAFNEQGLPEKGLLHYQRAMKFYEQTKDKHLISYASWGIGFSYYQLQRYPEALKQFEQTIEASPKVSPNRTNSKEFIGRVYADTGRPVEALKMFEEVIDLDKKSENPKEVARVQALMARIYQDRGELDRARHVYAESLKTFEQISDEVNRAAVLYAMGQLELSAKNYQEAERYLADSIQVTERVRRKSSISDLSVALSASVYDRYRAYIECLMRQHPNSPERQLDKIAFETSELARGRSLAELLAATATNLLPGVDPSLAAKEKSLRQNLAVKEDQKIRLLSGSYDVAELKKLEEEQRKFEAEYAAVLEKIRVAFPAFKQITQPAALKVAEIQQQLLKDDDTLLIEYSLGRERSYVWAVTRGGIATYELPGESVIVEEARKVYEGLKSESANSDSLTVATNRLSELILTPLKTETDKRTLIVVADGALNYIPFQMLTSPTNGDPLVAQWEVINVPSASVLSELQQEQAVRKHKSKTLALFGDPVYQSNYTERIQSEKGKQIATLKTDDDASAQRVQRDIEVAGDRFDPNSIQGLFHVQLELASLQQAVPADESLVMTGFAATSEQLKNADLNDYAILHIATHGFLDPKDPEHSGLALSTMSPEGKPLDGFLYLREIYGLRIPVNLVVLSACQTALGKNVRGEGLIGLTRGFMYAGASSVVASLWKVDDAATAELMRRFYGNMLERGMNKSAALRDAQNSMRQDPKWRAPYYWAAFTLQGDYRQVVRPTSILTKQRIIVSSLVTLVLGGLALWYWRRRHKTIVAN